MVSPLRPDVSNRERILTCQPGTSTARNEYLVVIGKYRSDTLYNTIVWKVGAEGFLPHVILQDTPQQRLLGVHPDGRAYMHQARWPYRIGGPYLCT